MTEAADNTGAEGLLPCPFCGSDELGLNRPSDQRTGPHWHDWFIRCYGCHVETSEHPTKAEAIAAWNTRIAHEAPQSGDTGRGDVVDSGFGGNAPERAEWLWAQLPVTRKWTSLETYEKALVCHLVTALAKPVDAPADVEAIRHAIINTPETADFMAGVPIEAAHQRDRWGTDHDAGKTPFDWFWLVGYLAQKAAASAVAGDTDKALHHTISTAAALANWHAALTGASTTMRPGTHYDNIAALRTQTAPSEPAQAQPSH